MLKKRVAWTVIIDFNPPSDVYTEAPLALLREGQTHTDRLELLPAKASQSAQAFNSSGDPCSPKDKQHELGLHAS